MTYSHHCNSFFAGAQWWLMASSKFSHGLWSAMALSSQTVPNPPFLLHWKVPSLYLADRNKAYLNSNQLFLIQRELLFFIIDSCAFFSVSLSWSHFSPFLCSAPTPAPLFFWGGEDWETFQQRQHQQQKMVCFFFPKYLPNRFLN